MFLYLNINNLNTKMKKMKQIKLFEGLCILGLCLVLSLASCAKEGSLEMPTPGVVDTDFAIVPSAALGGMTVKSRAAGVIEPDAATDIAVSVFRVDKGASAYPSDLTTATDPLDADLQGNTTGTGTDAKINFALANMQYYLSDGTPSKVLAVHPAITSDSWTAGSGAVTYTIDGKTDIMVTKWGEGYKNVAVNPAVAVQPTGMEFAHLLTQVHVRVYAEDATARDFWGSVKSISIRGREQSATVTVPAATETAFPALTASGTATALPLFKADGDVTSVIAPASIPLMNELDYDNAEEADRVLPVTVGYCMFAPVTTAAALPLTIVTEKESVETITDIVVATEQKYNAETAYTVTLVLTAQAIVPESVTIREWTKDESIDDIKI